MKIFSSYLYIVCCALQYLQLLFYMSQFALFVNSARHYLKGHDISQHDLISAWNHAEDMVAVSPLTANWLMSA